MTLDEITVVTNTEDQSYSFRSNAAVDSLGFSVTDAFLFNPPLFQRDGGIIVEKCNLVFSLICKQQTNVRGDF